MDFIPYGLSWESIPNFIDDKGYVRVLVENHPHSHKGYVYAHRLVMEAHEGRYLDPTEVVHHINEVKTDNRLQNLYLCTSEEHVQIHNRGKRPSLERRANIRKGMVEAQRRRNQKS